MRKRWLVGLLLAVVAASVIGGVVAADAGDTPPSNAGTPSTALIDRAAEKLGVDPDTLNDAYQQARDGLAADGLRAWLDALVENGNLTEDQAAEIESWLYAMPDAWESMPFGMGRFRVFGSLGARLPLTRRTSSPLAQ